MVIVNRFPSVSETFIYNELKALEECGYRITVVSCTDRDGCDYWLERNIRGPVIYGPRARLYGIAGKLILRTLWRPVASLRLLTSAIGCVPKSIRGFWRALEALVIADYIAGQIKSEGISHIHAHFLHRPALVAKLLGQLTGATHSISAHARDVFVPDFHLQALSKDAKFITVCSCNARAQLVRHIDPADIERIVYIPHGVDLEQFQPTRSRNREIREPIRLLSVCRLVPKKGIDNVLQALAIIKKRGRHFSYRIAGGGPAERMLRDLAARLGLEEVEFMGFVNIDQVSALYDWADVFILGCRMAEDGDRDGIPNAILEAMAMRVPVLATEMGGVPEVIRDRETGCLIPPDEPEAMAEAIERILSDASSRESMVTQARTTVETGFDLRRNIGQLVALLERQEESSSKCSA